MGDWTHFIKFVYIHRNFRNFERGGVCPPVSKGTWRGPSWIGLDSVNYRRARVVQAYLIISNYIRRIDVNSVNSTTTTTTTTTTICTHPTSQTPIVIVYSTMKVRIYRNLSKLTPTDTQLKLKWIVYDQARPCQTSATRSCRYNQSRLVPTLDRVVRALV